MDDLLEQGIVAYKAGRRNEARQFFVALVKQEPDNERAWGWMYMVANDDKERIYCMKQALRINPQNEKARELLKQLLEPPLNSPTVNTPLNSQPSGTNSVPQKDNKTLWVVGSIAVVFLFVIVLLGSYIAYDATRPLDSQTVPTSKSIVQVAPTQAQPTIPPTLSSEQVYNNTMKSALKVLDVHNSTLREWATLLTVKDTFKTPDPTTTYGDYIPYMLAASSEYPIAFRVTLQESQQQNLRIVKLSNKISDSAYEAQVALGGITPSNTISVPQKKILDCLDYRQKYFGILANVFGQGTLLTDSEIDILLDKNACERYSESFDIIQKNVNGQ